MTRFGRHRVVWCWRAVAMAGAAFSIAATASQAARALDVKAVEPSVVRLVQFIDGKAAGSGTGFVVGSDGLIVTNQHVVGCTTLAQCKIKIGMLHDGTPKPTAVQAELVALSPEYDLALVRVPGLSHRPLILAGDEPEKGTQVYAIGYPGAADAVFNGSGLSNATVTSGVVSRVVTASWGVGKPTLRLVQHNADINPGNSGGPLLDGCGRVVGVNTAGANVRFVPEALAAGGSPVMVPNGVFVASHVSALIGELKQRNISFTASSGACTPGEPKSDAMLWLVAAVATIALGAAGASFRRPPRLIVETYTQWRRRQGGAAPAHASTASGARAESQWRLEGMDGEGRPVCITLGGEPPTGTAVAVVVGRDPSVSDHSISDETISRQHARLTVMRGALHIEDLNSANGVVINGGPPIAPFTPTPVSSGARIEFGETQLTVSRV